MAATFTVAYSNGFETAVVEAEGRRLELQKVRTTLGMNPTPGLRPHHFGILGGDQFIDDFAGSRTPGGFGGPSVTTAGTDRGPL